MSLRCPRDVARRLVPLCAAMIAACAQRSPPPGGPIDNEAPTVLAVSPAAGATNVRPDSPIRIEFSEKLDKKSVERALRVFPDPGRRRLEWEGSVLDVHLAPDAPFGRSGERVLVLMASASDRRGNRLEAPLTTAYSTEEALPAGSIRGKLSGSSGRETARVLLYRAPGPPWDSLGVAPPTRETSRAADGSFALEYLETESDSSFALFALAQPAGKQLDPSRDWVGFGPDTIRITEEAPAIEGIAFSLVRPNATGSVVGRLAEEPFGTAVRMVSETDTAEAHVAETDSSGLFRLDSVAAGRYRLWWGGGDGEALRPFPDHSWVRVRPGEEVRLPGAELPVAPADSAAVADSLPADLPEEVGNQP